MNIDDITWWVLDGTPYAVDTAGLTALIGRLEGARSELWDARLGMEECYMYDGAAYCSMPDSRAALASRLAGMQDSEFTALLGLIDSLIRRVTLTRDIYAEAENTAEAAVRTMDPVLSNPLWLRDSADPGGLTSFLGQGLGLYMDWEEIDTVDMQAHLRTMAAQHSLLINPTGVVVDLDGTHAPGTIPAARFVASSLLDLLGYDHAYGNLSMSVLTGGGRRAPVVTTKDGEVTSGGGPLDVDGVPTDPITSMTDINDRILTMTDRAKAEGVGTIEVVRQEDQAGNVAWTVIVPGTQTWDFPPGRNPQDLVTNIQLVANEQNDLTDGIRLALDSLPIAPGDAVTFVGHSQGGDAAVDAAADPEIGGSLNTVGVVTYGAPTGASDPPAADVDVIHMVNPEDMVAGLAGVANTNTERQVTLFLDIGGPEAASGTREAHVGAPYAEAYDLIAEEGNDPAIQDIQQRISENSLWEGAVTAESYTFMFERTDLDDLAADVEAARGYAVR